MGSFILMSVSSRSGSKEEPKVTVQQTNSKDVTQDKPEPATTQEDSEMKDETKTDGVAPVAADSSEIAVETPVSAAKPKGGKRKSSGVPEHKGKKLNKKASMAKMTHTDAKPGDYFYHKLKGFPPWPVIVCDSSMLPETLTKSRPVTAARPDGTYREDYQDGGAKVKDRSFPVMYLHTNEFGWVPNSDLCDLDPEEVGTLPPKMRGDIAAARTLAAEQNDLDYFKEILNAFEEARKADKAAKEALKAEKLAEKQAKKAASTKKEKKSTAKAVEDDEDADIAMPDAIGDPESDGADATMEPAKTNKRKAEDTPQGSDSVKKPRTTIKLNTKKATNGVSTPKTPKEATPKTAKVKKSKATPKAVETPEAAAPKEPELTAEEKRAKKEKEILFLRHKLQKGLLTRDQEPKETEMKQMSEFIAKLQGYADLEVSIIRVTKINKVLKAILKLPFIPREEEFQFKERSQELLDKWNKLLATDTPIAIPAAPAASASTNGNGEATVEVESTKASPTEGTNGTKESSTEEKTEEKTNDKPVAEKAATAEVKSAPAEAEAEVESALVEPAEESKASITEPASVESAA